MFLTGSLVVFKWFCVGLGHSLVFFLGGPRWFWLFVGSYLLIRGSF